MPSLRGMAFPESNRGQDALGPGNGLPRIQSRARCPRSGEWPSQNPIEGKMPSVRGMAFPESNRGQDALASGNGLPRFQSRARCPHFGAIPLVLGMTPVSGVDLWTEGVPPSHGAQRRSFTRRVPLTGYSAISATASMESGLPENTNPVALLSRQAPKRSRMRSLGPTNATASIRSSGTAAMASLR